MKKIPVLFNEKMVCQSESFSPSAHKPAEVMQEWRDLFPESIEEILSPPIALADLALAHDAYYIRTVLSGQKENGFGNTSPAVAAALPYTAGAMLAAAEAALNNKKVAVAPVSGFHHAGYDFGGGFCTFNGLMVTAMKLLADDNRVKKVGILDLDQHYGNGTADIIGVFDIADLVPHYTMKGMRQKPAAFLTYLPTLIQEKFAGCDLLLYQAGADPHIDDPLGGWMTTEELAARDRIVFLTAKSMGIPVVWDLAGGYQNPLQKVLDIHNNTMNACCDVYL